MSAASSGALERYVPPVAAPPRAYKRPWWDPRRWFGWAVQRWRRSMQLRTVAITVVLCALAEIITGALLSARIADGLFQERVSQVKEEAAASLRGAQTTFDAGMGGNISATRTLVGDQLKAMRGDGSGMQPDTVLRVMDGEGRQWVPNSASSEVADAALTPALREAVATGYDVHWQSVTLRIDGRNEPGLAFGYRVELPPQRNYGLYLVYNLSQVQNSLNLIHGVLLLGGSLLLVVIGAIAWYVSRRALQPVAEAAATAEQLARGALDERMHVEGQDEVARLGRSFNRMADSLAAQIVQLETLSQMQQRFVSDVSHELRTPLTTVRMAAEVLHDARDDFDPINRRSAELLYDQVERFQTLLNDLLEISRFDAGAAVLDAGEWDLIPVVKRAIETAIPHAQAAGSGLELIAPDTPVVVEMDPRRVERVVRNLVMNAVEHGEGRPIEVRVAGDDAAAAVAVRDHGIGLSPLDVARVFDRFWRKDAARARTTGGSGLGLSISMQDARLHGGWLQAWGEPGEGSIFRLTLPREVGQRLTASPLPLADPVPGTAAEAEAVDADDTEWFPRVAEVFQEAEVVGESQTEEADETGPVPGTLPPGLAGASAPTGAMPIVSAEAAAHEREAEYDAAHSDPARATGAPAPDPAPSTGPGAAQPRHSAHDPAPEPGHQEKA
ncbi:MtrAB system histidine kinase MtrB [Galactobacter valiniphilus]|uniref:MtrAB system histidine kinase MtrB n=1 Tax=Galactobacter valiniphilus TaxID=2676122 RepID=UPI003736A390